MVVKSAPRLSCGTKRTTWRSTTHLMASENRLADACCVGTSTRAPKTCKVSASSEFAVCKYVSSFDQERTAPKLWH